MAAGRLIVPGWSPAVDADGVPIPNAKMFFYLNKTTTLATVYSDMALTVPLSNPVLANAAGQWPAMWADDANLFSVSIDAPYGPPGVPFTFDDLGPSTAANTSTAAKADKDAANVAGEDALMWPERILRQRADADSTPVSASVLLDRIYRAPIDFGAVGITNVAELIDETAELQAMVDGAFNSGTVAPGLPGGGVVEIDRTYYINSPLNLRKWVELRGIARGGKIGDHQRDPEGNPDQWLVANGSFKGTIICGPNGKIVLKDNCKVRWMNIISAGAAVIPPRGDPIAMRAYVNNFHNYPIALEPEYGGCDIVIEDNFIAGFELAMKFDYIERFDVRFNRVDCLNGIYAQDIYDDVRIIYNHFWPFCSAHRYSLAQPGAHEISREYGTGIKFGRNPSSDRSIDAGHIVGNMLFGFSAGIVLEHTNGLHCVDNWLDNSALRTDLWQTVGIMTEGNCRRTKLLGNHVDAHGVCYDFKGGGAICDNNTSTGFVTAAMRLWPGIQMHVGFHLIQDRGPRGIDLMDGGQQVHFDNLWFSVCNGQAIVNPTHAADRIGISFGDIKITDPLTGFVPPDKSLYTTSVDVRRTFTQTLAPETYTKIGFNQTLSDGLGEFNGALSSFSPKVKGNYVVDLSFGIKPGTTDGGGLVFEVRKNGGTLDQMRWQTFSQGTGALYQDSLSRTLSLEPGDDLTVFAYSDTGGTVESNKTFMSIRRLD